MLFHLYCLGGYLAEHFLVVVRCCFMIHLDPGMQRGSKRAYVAYMPRRLREIARSYTGRVPHEDAIEKRFRECGLPLKYMRKWWRQTAKEAPT